MSRMALLAWVLLGLLGGAILLALGQSAAAGWAWSITALPVAAHVAIGVARSLLGGKLGVDIIALAAILAAVAMSEPLTGAVVALMVAGGEALEGWAEGRATRALTALLARAPRQAARVTASGIEEIGVAAIAVGDILLVRKGETVPADGVLEDEAATLDDSALTGESLPVNLLRGGKLRSGAVNAGGAFRLRATHTADASSYAAIIRLTRDAAEARPPLARLADQWALGFVALTAIVAGGAWAWTGDAVRALAVLVVATPCPLILAAPIALVAGIGRAASRGIVIKGGGALERLARIRTVLFDKTGTLTTGQLRLVAMDVAPGMERDAALRLAGILAQGSTHPVSEALAGAARARALDLPLLDAPEEAAGGGVAGSVAGQHLLLGSQAFLARRGVADLGSLGASPAVVAVAGSVSWLAQEGRAVAVFVLADGLRPEAPRTLRALRALGVTRMVMLTGDRAAAAAPIAAALRLDAVQADCAPAQKIAVVQQESVTAPTAMVGDGINDAPALAAAGVGIAMGAQGTAAAAEAGDVVLLVDRLDRIVDAIAIAQRSRRIALQAIALGMGLSGLAMIAAAMGFLTPLAGAVLQEGIDVAAILFALTALRPGWREATPAPLPASAGLVERQAEHAALRHLAEALRDAADAMGAGPESLPDIAALEARLRAEVLPHQRAEERTLYPLAAQRLGGLDPMGPLIRMHTAIEVLVGEVGNLIAAAQGPDGWAAASGPLRRSLFELEAMLSLHLTIEEEALAEFNATAA
ncbi:heavy metal translocating P-type ATPase [Sediminicoccus sp. KRV36]|uniref:heavy metal translocating P-type ATPase n=1 Tax=Sediminicoccus sp. KRV36 TaxID=3133721 RepID=UPI00200DC679|nr:heavy metal translocating P-type ATPase [Sediminicoccus rosea]UPY35628.1 heavy metal translocating P-type ATPase [Sediminicoccus rosea]